MMLDNKAIVSVLLKDSLIVFYRTRRGPTLPASNEKGFGSLSAKPLSVSFRVERGVTVQG